MLKVKKHLNKLITIRSIILLMYAVLFLMITINGTVKKYVHPRIIPYLLICSVMFIFIALFQIKVNSHQHLKPYNRVFESLVFLIPITMFLLLPKTGLVAEGFSVDGINTDYTSASQPSIIPGEIEVSGDLELKNADTIVVNDNNYQKWIEELYLKTDRYQGKTIHINGFVHREENFQSNMFVVARFLMSCCTADAEAIGILCSSDGMSEVKDGQWIDVYGTLTKKQNGGKTIPCINIQSLIKIEKPENEYIYSK